LFGLTCKELPQLAALLLPHEPLNNARCCQVLLNLLAARQLVRNSGALGCGAALNQCPRLQQKSCKYREP
jgi:hypothetical protein